MDLEIIDYQEKRYLVKYKCVDYGITSEQFDWYKFYYRSDLILKKNDILFFVEEIPEIEFEEIEIK